MKDILLVWNIRLTFYFSQIHLTVLKNMFWKLPSCPFLCVLPEYTIFCLFDNLQAKLTITIFTFKLGTWWKITWIDRFQCKTKVRRTNQKVNALFQSRLHLLVLWPFRGAQGRITYRGELTRSWAPRTGNGCVSSRLTNPPLRANCTYRRLMRCPTAIKNIAKDLLLLCSFENNLRMSLFSNNWFQTWFYIN